MPVKISKLSPVKFSPPSGEVVKHNVTSKCFGKKIHKTEILSLQLPGCVTLDNLLNLSELQFLCLYKERILRIVFHEVKINIIPLSKGCCEDETKQYINKF